MEREREPVSKLLEGERVHLSLFSSIWGLILPKDQEEQFLSFLTLEHFN